MAEDILLYPFRNQLKKHFGGRDRLYPWLEFASIDIVKFEDDFVSDEDVAYKWGEKADAGSKTGLVAGEPSICRLTTSATNDKYVGIFPATDGSLQGACFYGDQSPVMWTRLAISNASDVKIEVGFTDADDDAGAVAVLDTPSTLAEDCALWIYDTDDAAGLYWQGVAAEGSTTPTKVEPALFLPVATTYEWMGVAIQGDAVKYMRCDAYGNPTYESAWQVSSVSSDVALIPWIFVQARTDTAKNLDVDYVIAYQRRTSADD